MGVLADSEPDVIQRIYVDPSSQEITGDTSYFNVQRFFRSFHMALFKANFFSVSGVPIGYFVVAIFAIPLLASMITALVFYRRWWRNFLALKFGREHRAFWSSAHKVAGRWSLWFVSIIGITGV
ncbi:PepSY-associated TM helix domain-containing protein [Croceicoccus sp. F390]|uniref:PepSY-associated TM helix domain-containing protein n=2 Tax=Croceicoccus esteveae TaxID=3075597 RepID=A0ABU2ZL50_9SPHN|nr:PepSY-associated TM helix domain-containing protein [Croceicoccus sp. F390]MDT0577054.1 PepSY-associated TM helix domain-containing protein [Croceicoccus sp. F390]